MGPKMGAWTQKDPEMYSPEQNRTHLLLESRDQDQYRSEKCRTLAQPGDANMIDSIFKADFYWQFNII